VLVFKDRDLGSRDHKLLAVGVRTNDPALDGIGGLGVTLVSRRDVGRDKHTREKCK
jgi:hypothetical protein